MNKLTASCLDRDTLRQVLGEGVGKGDALMVHAALGAVGHLEEGPESLIDTLFQLVGDRGTLVMPTATTYFTKTAEFDLLHSPSVSGLLSETFRKWPDVKRSCVPMASFSALGWHSGWFARNYHSYLDDTSPFSALLELDGKVLLYGVDYNKCTLYHLAEERASVNYNFYKSFTGWAIGSDGGRTPTSQTYFVRRDTTLKKDALAVGHRFEETGNVTKRRLGNGVIRIFSARRFDEFCMEEIGRNPRVFIADDHVLQ